MPVNRQTIARASYRLGDASEYTQLVRWEYASAVTSLHSGSSVFSLRSVAAILREAISTVPFTELPCIVAVFYSGGTPDALDFPEIYDGDGLYPIDVTLMDGGLPNSNFC